MWWPQDAPNCYKKEIQKITKSKKKDKAQKINSTQDNAKTEAKEIAPNENKDPSPQEKAIEKAKDSDSMSSMEPLEINNSEVSSIEKVDNGSIKSESIEENNELQKKNETDFSTNKDEL